MYLNDLIERAGEAAGSLGRLAKAMHKHPARISEWRHGRRKPDASEIAYMADIAGLPVLITVAMIEAQLNPDAKAIWEKALGEK